MWMGVFKTSFQKNDLNCKSKNEKTENDEFDICDSLTMLWIFILVLKLFMTRIHPNF